MEMNSLKKWDWAILQPVFINFFIYENESNDTNIIQYFIMNGMGLCIKLNSFVAHMFYA